MALSGPSLVLVASQHDGPPTPPGEAPGQPGNGHPTPSTILVVEDEVLIRLATCDYLRHCGYRIIEGSTAEEAQRVFRAGQPIEVLFSDIELGPGMDGLGLAKWVRQHFPQVRILLASGVARVSEQAEDLSDGPFFAKPYAHEMLETHLRRLVGLIGRRAG